MFRSTGSYEPDPSPTPASSISGRFRSTGSYEPDQRNFWESKYLNGFDPQALTSLTRQRRCARAERQRFDPQALTSLTLTIRYMACFPSQFRSTGSYEPDPKLYVSEMAITGFDPQALTSLTRMQSYQLLIHRSFDPQALTSLTLEFGQTARTNGVSIHRLLRA